MTFKNYLLGIGHSSATAGLNEKCLFRFIGWCEDQQIESEHATYNEILSYMLSLQQTGLKQRSVQLYIVALKHYFKWVIASGGRADHPCETLTMKGIERRTLYHIIPMAELEALYSQFRDNEIYPSGNFRSWHRQSHNSTKIQQIAYGLMLWQGVATGELCRLRLEDIKLREGTVYIRGGRRSNERILKLESIQLMDLLDYIQNIRPFYVQPGKLQTDHFLVTTKSRVISRGFIYELLKRLKSHHNRITCFNQLRTCVITHWLKQYNLREVQYMAGHRYVSSTEAYQVNDMESLKSDIDKFHPLG